MTLHMHLFDRDAILDYRIKQKLRETVMREDTKEYKPNLVKQNGVVMESTLTREGFAKVAKNPFKLDIDMLQRYYEPIKLNLLKGIRKAVASNKLTDKYLSDEANYETIVKYVLDHYMIDNTYNLEKNVSDSRGRSIYQALKRVGNPITAKDFRALLVVPTPMYLSKNNTKALNDIYYFIAELTGSKATTEQGKIDDGCKAFTNRELPVLDLTNEDDRDELHELIWLERIYNRLDALFASKLPGVLWEIPLEIDCSMSVNQIVGALTNDKRLLTRTNVIGDTIRDPWHVEGVRRLAIKKVGTPTFYGSSESAISLLKKANITPCKTELALIKKEFTEGGLAITKAFKDAIIKNYNAHTPIIPMKIWNETFDLEVSKWRASGSKIVVTEAFDSKSNKYKRSFTHKVNYIPDYKHQKLFFATCLVHNLDSQAINWIAVNLNAWCITIHDALIALPGVCGRARELYAVRLKAINNDRNSIIMNFRKSIGATDTKSDVAFYKLYNRVEQADDVKFNPHCMK
jgi:hypothetical protein